MKYIKLLHEEHSGGLLDTEHNLSVKDSNKIDYCLKYMYSKREPQTKKKATRRKRKTFLFPQKMTICSDLWKLKLIVNKGDKFLLLKDSKRRTNPISKTQMNSSMSYNIVDDRLIQKQYKNYDLINAHSLAVWEIIILQNITVQ